ncbi:MAG: chromosome segregation protein SMC [Steroidobacteraceae bacterium]
MRLNKVKLAGFKSFVDPTSVQLPGNLTGVVGPNGCGKSNIIDAVRWVMGELSARHLRGDSMADVIFNGSSARKPIGAASVELVFDNSDGKIGGAYASYSEVSLKRAVARDGSSAYFINGGRCRRKDITHLFLGTGLGTRSYAIIEQDMISRVVEARHDDMRAFIEEAAGISLYKERRRETESRMAEARENLARLQDLRDEVDSQIRHLQRQAKVARRYQEYKTQERTLGAELLALKLRALDSGAQLQDGAVRGCELAVQQALAEQRAAEAALERRRALHNDLGEAHARAQGRYYELAAEVTRTQESIRYGRERRESTRSDLAKVDASLAALASQILSEQQQLEALRTELMGLEPLALTRTEDEASAAAALSTAESQLASWHERWESHNREFGSAAESAKVELARIEQLETQSTRLQAQAERLRGEHAELLSPQTDATLASCSELDAAAHAAAEARTLELDQLLAQLQRLRAEQQASDERLERERAEREQSRAELMALDALQKAALCEKNPSAGAWLAGLPAAKGAARLAQLLAVDAGWERAVETVLGEYLEAVQVEALEQLAPALAGLEGGAVGFFEASSGSPDGARGTLASHVRGPAATLAWLSQVRTADSLAAALRQRSALAPGQSLITASGEWVGREWLRVNRGGDGHAGVLEREQRLKALREVCTAADRRVQSLEQDIASARERIADSERQREAGQIQLQIAHRERTEMRGRLEALKARLEEGALRRARIEDEWSELSVLLADSQRSLQRARETHAAAVVQLERLALERALLETEREPRREQLDSARAQAQVAQRELRDTLVLLESRRAGRASTHSALQRMLEQRSALGAQRAEHESTLARADTPIAEAAQREQEQLAARVQAEEELAGARRALEDSEREVTALDQRRLDAQDGVAAAREATQQARLAAQASSVRREALLEQFAATRCELGAVLANLDADAQAEAWEQRLTQLRVDIEQLGQVNLTAIDELAAQNERKSYLDRQFTDVSDALGTLDQAMRKMDRETRARFDDTFNRINAGLQDKFPRLFGGGHAYLELVGDDPLAAGVAVMARPPGKRNSTIAQLSGGEKALTAVALVFSIFDLNPAPFCLLDEVDAPLDEHNVARFCDIVREMSSRVQFIFITHNKITMELASQLIGVTMNEPGVSRLVAVDIEEAVRLAAI